MIPIGVLASSYVAPAGGLSLSFISAHVSGAANSFTVSGVNIGDASTSRSIIVCVGNDAGGGGWRNITGLTIGGVTATIDVTAHPQRLPTAIGRAAVPTGTTANITMSLSGVASALYIAIFRLDGAVAVSDTAIGSTSATVTGATGGVIIASAAGDSAAGNTWTNLTEAWDTSKHSGGSTDATGDVTISHTNSTFATMSAVAYAPA